MGRHIQQGPGYHDKSRERSAQKRNGERDGCSGRELRGGTQGRGLEPEEGPLPCSFSTHVYKGPTLGQQGTGCCGELRNESNSALAG